MKAFGFLEPFLCALNDGKIIRLILAWALRIVAVLLAVVGLLWCIAAVTFGAKATETFGPAAHVLPGAIVFAFSGLAWGVLACGIHFFRARSIEELGDSQFVVLSVVSQLFRLAGELAFVTYTLIGVGGCLFVWFTDLPFSALPAMGIAGALAESLPFARMSGSGFLGGVEMLLMFLILAFLAILFFYALAESTVVLVEIALNTRALAPAPAGISSAPASSASVLHVPSAQQRGASAQSGPSACRSCGTSLEAGAAFCETCGVKVG